MPTWQQFIQLIKSNGYTGKGDDLDEVKRWMDDNRFDPYLGDDKIDVDRVYKATSRRRLDATSLVEQAKVDARVQEQVIETIKGLGYDKVNKARVGEDHSQAISVKDMVEDDQKLGYPEFDQNGLGQFLTDVRKAATCSRSGKLDQMPERLVKAQRIQEQRILKAGQGMNEAVDSDGGFLAMPQHSDMLLRKIYKTSVIAPRCRQVQMDSRQITVPYIVESSRADGSRHGGIQGFWQAEGAGKTASQGALGRLTLTAHKLYAYGFVTDELQEDSSPAALQLIGELFTEELGFKLDDAIFNGTGAGMPLGVVNAPAFQQVTRLAVDVISGIDLANAWMRMPVQNRATAVWCIAQDAEAAMMGAALVPVPAGAGFNQLFWNPANSATNNLGYNTLSGRPVLVVEQLPQLTSPNSVVFMDPEAYLLGIRRGVTSATSIHVAFATDETAFKMTMRCDGQPWWDSALTPFSGSAALLTPFLGNTT